MPTTNDFAASLEAFLAALQAREDRYIAANFKNLTPSKFSAEAGRRYVRIVKASTHGTSRSVHCFVEQGTGNIFKAAGWKAPTTKHVRGNIFAENPLVGTNVYGANLVGNLDGMNGVGN
jgi:hypothetical protein